ncbi:MAG: radical SAM protein [Bacteroidetes bacterium GWA2_30_7]|nr:MAG: radical SAM protein [Bacteroidetes bacterium GWA2_30_7]
MKTPKSTPFLVYCDNDGNLFEDTNFEAVGRTGNTIKRLLPEDFIELPEGSDFFFLKDRNPVGYDIKNNKITTIKNRHGAAAFISPAYTQTYLTAFEKTSKSPILPLYAYSVLGWLDDKFYTCALRIDSDIRQDCNQFNQKTIEQNVKLFKKKYPNNRLIKHLSYCALTYFCPAARNYFLNRWEAPLPTSPTCNSNCLGCISYQPKSNEIISTQNRITFVPSPEEIAETAIAHLNTAPNPIVSFGQGCEGEPLMAWETIKEAIILIRKKTQKGIINLNTNGSKTNAIEELCKIGIDSFRISINSFRKELYNKYYKPNNYTFENVIDSISVARKYNNWVSVNYFVSPGITDDKEEINELYKIIQKTGLNMIQWRNFNIDPDWFYETLKIKPSENLIGIQTLINDVTNKFPNIYNGYFNPGKEIIERIKI